MIPKIIFIFWHDKTNLPELVKNNYELLKKNNPDFKLILLDKQNICKYINFEKYKFNLDDKEFFTPARLSDYIRIFLIYKYGGIWIDASLIIWKKIDSFIDRTKDCIFYENKNNRNKGNIALESWFIAAKKKHVFIKKIKKELLTVKNCSDMKKYIHNMEKNNIKFQLNVSTYYHFIYHVFNNVLQSNPEIEKTVLRLEVGNIYPNHIQFPKQLYFLNFNLIQNYIAAIQLFKCFNDNSDPGNNMSKAVSHVRNCYEHIYKITVFMEKFQNKLELPDRIEDLFKNKETFLKNVIANFKKINSFFTN